MSYLASKFTPSRAMKINAHLGRNNAQWWNIFTIILAFCCAKIILLSAISSVVLRLFFNAIEAVDLACRGNFSWYALSVKSTIG